MELVPVPVVALALDASSHPPEAAAQHAEVVRPLARCVSELNRRSTALKFRGADGSKQCWDAALRAAAMAIRASCVLAWLVKVSCQPPNLMACCARPPCVGGAGVLELVALCLLSRASLRSVSAEISAACRRVSSSTSCTSPMLLFPSASARSSSSAACVSSRHATMQCLPSRSQLIL